jgi:hypothetical protein
MREAEKADDISVRGQILNEYFTYSLYVNVCRSLFETHKLMLSLLLCIKILQNRGEIDAREWRLLLSGPSKSDWTEKNPAPEWMTQKMWVEVLSLGELAAFKGFASHFVENLAHYKVRALMLQYSHAGSTSPQTCCCVFHRVFLVRVMYVSWTLCALASWTLWVFRGQYLTALL